MKQITEIYNLLHVGAAPEMENSPDRTNPVNLDRMLLLTRRFVKSSAVPTQIILMINRMQHIIQQMSDLINTNECAVQRGEEILHSQLEDLLESTGEFEQLFRMIADSIDDITNLAARVQVLLEKLIDYIVFDSVSSSVPVSTTPGHQPPGGFSSPSGSNDRRRSNKTFYKEKKRSKVTGERFTLTALEKRKRNHEILLKHPRNIHEKERFFSTTAGSAVEPLYYFQKTRRNEHERVQKSPKTFGKFFTTVEKIPGTVQKSLKTLSGISGVLQNYSETPGILPDKLHKSPDGRGKSPERLFPIKEIHGKLSGAHCGRFVGDEKSPGTHGNRSERLKNRLDMRGILTNRFVYLSETHEIFSEGYDLFSETLKINYILVRYISKYIKFYIEINALNPGKSVVGSTAASMAGSVFKPKKTAVRYASNCTENPNRALKIKLKED